MVRDVWVDGSGVTGQGRREAEQRVPHRRHLRERCGGTQYTALDVTTPTTPVTMLWTFPQPSPRTGATWASPGPTSRRARRPSARCASPTADRPSRGFDGALDRHDQRRVRPGHVQGRAVFMVDAWTGGTALALHRRRLQDPVGFGRIGTSMFPVPGAVALLDVGDPNQAAFDTGTASSTPPPGATWAATSSWPGSAPGTSRPATRLVTTGTRPAPSRSSGRRRHPERHGPQQFFFMTANAYEPTTRTLRTFLGSGNRERSMQQGAACGPRQPARLLPGGLHR